MDSIIKAIVFDAYGTLFDVHSVSAGTEKLFPGRGAELAALWREKQIEYTHLRTLSSRYADFWGVTGDALRFCCERLELRALERDHECLMSEYLRLAPFAETVSALLHMRSAGVPLAILSNGTREMLDPVIKAAGIEDLFEHVLSADQVKKFKTAPEVYQLGPDAFGCRADEILFVSSNGWDVCGATWFGYTTFWINRGNRPRERLDAECAAIGHNMHDVARFLEIRMRYRRSVWLQITDPCD